MSRSMRRRSLPPAWQNGDDAVAGHIQPDDAFGGLTEADQPPPPVQEHGHERLARYVEGVARASANLAALADGIGQRRRQNAQESRVRPEGRRAGYPAGNAAARPGRVNSDPAAPNLARALERAIAAEPDHWNSQRLHVSDTRHALIGEGCPRQLWLRL